MSRKQRFLAALFAATMLCGCTVAKGLLQTAGVTDKPVPVAIVDTELGPITVLSDGTTTASITLPTVEPMRLSTKGNKKYKPVTQ